MVLGRLLVLVIGLVALSAVPLLARLPLAHQQRLAASVVPQPGPTRPPKIP